MTGLSPRRRGNHCSVAVLEVSARPIPAQAGEPTHPRHPQGSPWAYPRAGGGTRISELASGELDGLSPRRRGNRCRDITRGRLVGPIPAQAGEPCCRPAPSRTTKAYPRAGGGTYELALGTRIYRGLSPRRRGNHRSLPDGRRRTGPIPAQAGEPRWKAIAFCSARAYPRAGGGTIVTASPSHCARGLSPRRRGNHGALRLTRQAEGPIPAQAGEPTPSSPRCSTCWAYPRAGGGT